MMRCLLDLHDRLRSYVGNDGSSQKSTVIMRCAAEAVNRITSQADWYYYMTMGRITTNAPYNTGTVSFDLTGGAYERMWTLTGGTWPAWAATYGTITINNIPYDIDKRISDTVITGKVSNSPNADIAAGQAYLLYDCKYDLPSDFQTIQKPIVSNQNRIISKVGYEEFINRQNSNDGVSTPYIFTLIDNGFGGSQILLWNPPDTVYTLAFEYKRKPVMPVIAEERTGKISLVAGQTTVTGLSTNFNRAMVGAVLRVSYDSTPPTGFDSINPPQSEYLIDSFTSTTSLQLTTPATDTVVARAYVISSRVDVADGPMWNFLVQMGYKALRIADRINAVAEERGEYERAAMEAKSFDGQHYSGTDKAGSTVAMVGMRPPSYMRTVSGNG